MVFCMHNFQETKQVEKVDQQAIQRLKAYIMKQDLQIFDNFRPFGSAFFTNQIQKTQNLRLFNHKLLKKFQAQYWNIKINNQQEKKKLEQIFKIMIESQTNFLSFKGFPMSNIFKTISHIKFHELTQLNLYKCQIVNIQALTFIDAPNLKTLNLIYNYVYQYKSLAKTNFKLERLFIYLRCEEDIKRANFHARIDDSSRWNFNLNELKLQKHLYNKIIMQDLSFLFKLKHKPNSNLNTTISMNTKRILQRKLYSKYFNDSNINIKVFDLYDDPRQFPIERYIERQKFYAINIQRQ